MMMLVFQKTILHIVEINHMSPVKRVTFVSSGEYYIGAFNEAVAISDKK